MLKITHVVRVVTIATTIFLGQTLGVVAAVTREVTIKVGVVQRFGDEVKAPLVLQATEGDRLTFSFKSGSQVEELSAPNARIEIVMEALPQPQWEEKLVIRQVGTFETAEDYANQWQAKGIATEITQPSRWQVWAKRDVYNTPLLRRLLLQSLQAQGDRFAFIESKILSQVPKASLVINGVRYARDEIEITSQKNLIQVKVGEKTRTLYPGRLKIQPNAYGNYTLVNEVYIEDYLRGVVPHEIGPNAPYNAVEAQTIIARTYALRNLRRFTADNYELCASTHCQVYQGWNGTVGSADRAIAATAGQVLVYQNELVDGLYSSATGGVTAKFSDVWNGFDRPYLIPVIDSARQVWDLSQKSLADENNFRAFINTRQGFNEAGVGRLRWREEASLGALTSQLKTYLNNNKLPLADFTKILQMQVISRSTSGRILNLAVDTDKGRIEVKKNEIRTAFDPPDSTLFYLEPLLNENRTLQGYAFVGGGFGHGVGMSQTGAYNLANLGFSGEQILLFYYPGTKLQPLTDAIVFWQEPTLPVLP